RSQPCLRRCRIEQPVTSTAADYRLPAPAVFGETADVGNKRLDWKSQIRSTGDKRDDGEFNLRRTSMKRRQFLGSSLAVSALAAGASSGSAGAGQGASNAAKGREDYELRRYQLQSGPQRKIADAYFRDALVPGFNRLGISPIGVFTVDIGPESPTFYVLM